ncbi:transposase [Candidatus Woesearchaeota archaeon]|nr:transposase [Candidatus Woesearchaeota archaeon]
MAYIASNKNQDWLLPLPIKDMISKDHICFLVEEFADDLGYTRFGIMYDGAGHPAYPPRIIMKIIIHGMLSRIRSSRKLAAGCRENFVMMYLAEKTTPDFRTIASVKKS